MVKDKVCIGSTENNLCVNDFLFLSAYDMSEDPFKTVDFDGIIGLGFSDLSFSPESNFLDFLLSTNKISNKIFAFYFRKTYDIVDHNLNLSSNEILKEKNYANKFSEITIGGVDFTKIKSDIKFYDVISKRYWEIKIDNIYYGNYKLSVCENILCTAIVDTGTSTMGSSSKFYRLINELIDLKKDCSNLNELKPLVFEIGNHFYELDSRDYTMKMRRVKDDYEYLVPDEKNDGK